MSRIWCSFRAVTAVLILFLVDKVVLLLATAVIALYLMNKISDSSGSSSSSSVSSSSLSSSSFDDDVGDGAFDPIPAAYYEVFLSFRGPDVRTVFADFLYGYLDHSKIRTFLDDKELIKGDEIEGSLYKAIEDSKVYIPILSPDYASSKWCLRELSHMVKHCNKPEGKGIIILPIFYMMNPRDVRHHSDSYSEAFIQHSKRYDVDTIKEWKEALLTVGKKKGWHVTKSNRQGLIVREVFSRVRLHLMRNYLLVTEQLVNINPHVDQVTNLLNKGVKVVGIVGMGGLGKSTIAMAVRDKVYTEFGYCCFLRNVRQTLTESGGILTLQRQIISAIPGYDGNVQDPSQGVHLIRDIVCKEKCLIIIDDVDENFVFEQILGKLDDFSSGSRFIITTRDRGVLKVFQHVGYEPEGLDHDHSLQLFSRHAFGLNYPPQDRVALSEEFVKVAAGLPLALKVVGATLHGKNERFWKQKLVQLKVGSMPADMLRKTLMISYSDLTSEEQQIFLDIASVFIGVSKELPYFMWNDRSFYPEIGIDALIFKSLIKVTKENRFWMHDSIRDLGRTIIYEEDRRCPWKRSRIWSNEDALKMLTKGEGTDRLEVLKVNMANNNMVLSDIQFKKLPELRYLQVSYGELKGNLDRILPSLCWLALENCSLMHTDTDMMKSIVFIQRTSEDSRAVDDCSDWENLQEAHRFKAIDLWNCNGLGKVPTLTHYKAPEPFEFNTSLEDLKDGLELDSGGVKAIGIVGIDGIGKTTIAKALYNEVRGQFDGCCFIEDAWKSLKSDGIVSLQREIIRDILQRDCKVESFKDGINIIKTTICKMKVLIVLDELDEGFPYNETLGEIEDFHSGSRFIITTNDRYVVTTDFSQACRVYELDLMNVYESLRLFRRHAFGADSPPEENISLEAQYKPFGWYMSLEDWKDGLQLDSGGVKAIAILGTNDIGKTTVVRALYNEVRGQFDACCFIEDVAEILWKSDGVVSLQREIIRSILQSDCKVESVKDGINIIKTTICKMKVLIVLDELDKRWFPFNETLGEIEDFHSGSRFIITTKDQYVVTDVFSFFQACRVYELDLMNVEESLRLFEHAFGADSPPEENMSLEAQYKAPEPFGFNINADGLQLDSGGVKVIAIVGKNGIGKTTVVRALYDEVRGQFDACCFIEDAWKSMDSDSVVSLQREIIRGILQSDCNIEDVKDGINIIKTRICKMKVLIVLDELDTGFLFHRTFGDIDDFHSGSRFIIVTKDQDVFWLFEGCRFYELDVMNVDESLRLFRIHALGAYSPPEEEVDLSMEIVNVLRGHPLFVKVIGSLLFRRDQRFWKDILVQIHKAAANDLFDVMVVSHDLLSHEEHRIFLDIALFLHGADKSQAFLMWESCGLHPESAVATLVQRCLIEINQVDEREEFWMCSMLRDFGQHIYQLSGYIPLTSDRTYSKSGALMFNQFDGYNSLASGRIYLKSDALDMLNRGRGDHGMKGLKVEAECKDWILTEGQFVNLPALVYLEVYGGDFQGNFKNILPDIRWLKMHNCPNPIGCDMQKLVILHIQGSSVTDDWEGWENLKMARNLKIICLHQCNHLESVPDLSYCENLESIDIQQCAKMSGELHISHFRHLKVLKIVDTSITKITGDIGMLQNMQEITLPRRLLYVT